MTDTIAITIKLITYLVLNLKNYKITAIMGLTDRKLLISRLVSLGSPHPFLLKIATIEIIDQDFYVEYFPGSVELDWEYIRSILSKFDPKAS